jgi:predicted nucleotide-binding protein
MLSAVSSYIYRVFGKLNPVVALQTQNPGRRHNSMASIFLSHSHADKAFANKLAEDIHQHSHAVWIDEAEIQIGDSLIEKIREGLDLVDYVGAILSKSSIESEWVKKELDVAMNMEIDNKRVTVLPLLLEDVELPGVLKGKMYADFRGEERYADGLSQLSSRPE